MKKDHYIKLIITIVTLLVPVSLIASNCIKSFPINQSLSINDRNKNTTVTTCDCTGLSTISISSTVTSSLVKANSFLTVSFLNKKGTTLSAWNSKPLIGKFTNLEFNHHIEVPKNAVKTKISISINSKYEFATGSIQYQFSNLGKGLNIALYPSKYPVLVSKSKNYWNVKGNDVPDKVEAVIKILDLENKQWHQETINIKNLIETFKIPDLPVGYYKIMLTATAPNYIPLSIKGSFVIIEKQQSVKDIRFGVDSALSWYGGEMSDVQKALDILKLSGVGSIRDRLSWAHTQPKPDQIYWSRYKEVAKKSHSMGYELVTTFHNSPIWSRPGDTQISSDRRPPTDLNAVERYGSIFAQDLGDYIQAIEFWNEPNTLFFPDYPWQYANLLKSFSAGVRQKRPEMKILIGAAAGEPNRFYEQVYDNGVEQYFDIRNQHYYGKINNLVHFFKYKVRPIEYKHNIHLKPGWMTETGLSIRRDNSGNYDQLKIEQAAYLIKAYSLALANGYEKVFFFILRELQEADFHNWGILNQDFTPRPAFASLAALTHSINRKPILASNISKYRSVIYFGKKNGPITAIAWGKGSLNNVASSYEDIFDFLGRKIDKQNNIQLSDKPILITGISSLPSKALVIRTPSALNSFIPPFRLQIDLNKPKINHFSKNKQLTVKVDKNSEIILHLTTTLNTPDKDIDIKLNCSGSRGIITQNSNTQNLHLSSNNPSQIATCKFIASLNRYGYIAAEAISQDYSENVKIALEPILTNKFQTAVPAKNISATECFKTVKRSSKNVELSFKYIDNPNSKCKKVKILSKIIDDGETWVFPAWKIDGKPIPGNGLHITIENIPNINHPPRQIIAQLVEKNGAIWLLKLQSEVISQERTNQRGLFSSAKLAPWSSVKKTKLDLNNIREILLGWGGYGGQKGQAFGYTVESLSFVEF